MEKERIQDFIKALDDIRDLKGMVKAPQNSISLKEMKRAISDGAAAGVKHCPQR